MEKTWAFRGQWWWVCFNNAFMRCHISFQLVLVFYDFHFFFLLKLWKEKTLKLLYAFECVKLRDRSVFTGGGGGLLFFRKVVEKKKYDPPLQHDKQNYDPPPAKGEKNCDPPPIPFFYFHLIFFNKNNIFYKMCSLQQLFCIFWKSWKAVFLHSQAKEADHSQPFVLYVFDDIFWPVFSSEGPSWSIES